MAVGFSVRSRLLLLLRPSPPVRNPRDVSHPFPSPKRSRGEVNFYLSISIIYSSVKRFCFKFEYRCTYIHIYTWYICVNSVVNVKNAMDWIATCCVFMRYASSIYIIIIEPDIRRIVKKNVWYIDKLCELINWQKYITSEKRGNNA